MKKVLKQMEQLFGDIPHWFIGGAVLGYVREGRLLKNDDDLDYLIHFENLDDMVKRLVAKFDNVVVSSQAVNNNVVLRPIDGTSVIRIIKFNLNGIPIDIDVGFTIGNSVHNIVKGDEYVINDFPKKFFEKMMPVKFEGVECSMPQPAKEFVEINYGKDWRVPKSEWSCVINPPCIIRDKKRHNRIMSIIKGERCAKS